MTEKRVRRTVTHLGDADLAKAMDIVNGIFEREPDCASRSYLNQRVGERIGYGLAIRELDSMAHGRAIVKVPGVRKGFPIVCVKGPSWTRMWEECHAEKMDYGTLKRMNA